MLKTELILLVRQHRKEGILKEIMLKTEPILLVRQHLKEEIPREIILKTEQPRQDKLPHKEQNLKAEEILQENQRHKEQKVKEGILPETTIEDPKNILKKKLKNTALIAVFFYWIKSSNLF